MFIENLVDVTFARKNIYIIKISRFLAREDYSCIFFFFLVKRKLNKFK